VAPRACAIVAFIWPWFGTAQVEWHVAIVDPLLVSAESIPGYGGSGGHCPL